MLERHHKKNVIATYFPVMETHKYVKKDKFHSKGQFRPYNTTFCPFYESDLL